MRLLKIAGIVVGALVALVVIALVYVALFVDPNDYRDDIERLVQRETGRELDLAGELKLSVFPWLAIETGPARLGDAPGFGDEPFVSIQEARMSVRLWPLLRGKIEAGTVRLVGARIRLITDEQGRNNWDDLGAGGEPQAAPEPDRPGQMELPTIAGLEIVDSSLYIENRQENTRRSIRNFNLKTGALRSGRPFDLQTGFVFDQGDTLSLQVDLAARVTADLERNVHRLDAPQIQLLLTGGDFPAEGIPVEIRATTIDADVGQETHRLSGFGLTTTWRGEGFPDAGVPVSLSAGELNANLADQSMELTDVAMDVAGARLKGALSGTQILDAPSIRGPLELEPVSLREWLPKLGVALPETRDPEVLQRLSFSGQVALTERSAEVGDIVLKLDDTTAQGSVGVADFEDQALRFDLRVDRIDADRYLPPPVENEDGRPDEEGPVEIPVDMLRELNARGQLEVGEAIFAGLTFSKLRLGVDAAKGQVRFSPIEASMYGGTHRGTIGIDATGKAARVSLDNQVSGVDFAPLFRDLFETDRISGNGTAAIKLAGTGRTTDDLMKTLDGTVSFKVADGAVNGVDLWYEIRRARAVLRRQEVPARSGTPRTEFTALAGSGVMQNGVLKNDDLTVATQYLRIAGTGMVDLPNSELDYRLTAQVLRIPPEGADAEQMKELVDARIPVTITGSLTDPTVRPDIEGLVKGEVKQRLEKEREKLEDKVKDRLRDLFNR